MGVVIYTLHLGVCVAHKSVKYAHSSLFEIKVRLNSKQTTLLRGLFGVWKRCGFGLFVGGDFCECVADINL